MVIGTTASKSRKKEVAFTNFKIKPVLLNVQTFSNLACGFIGVIIMLGEKARS